MAKYLPDILSGMVRHHRAGGADRHQRPARRAGAGAAAQPRHPAAQLADHLRRRPVPLAAAAGHHRADLLRPAGGRHLAVGLRLDLAVARPGADGLLRGDLLGRHHLDAQGPVGGLALDRPVASARRCSTWCCRRRCGSPSRRSPTAPSPSPRAPRSAPWWRCSEILGQASSAVSNSYNPVAADDGRGGLPRAVPAGRRARRAGSRRKFAWKR